VPPPPPPPPSAAATRLASRATHAAVTKSRVSRCTQAAAVAPCVANTAANAATSGRGRAAARADRTAVRASPGTHSRVTAV